MDLFTQFKDYVINDKNLKLVNVAMRKEWDAKQEVKKYCKTNNLELNEVIDRIQAGAYFFDKTLQDYLFDVIKVNETIRTDVIIENGKLKDPGRPYFGTNFMDYVDIVAESHHEKLLHDVREFRDSCLCDLNEMSDQQYLQLIEDLIKKKDNLEQPIYSLRLNTLRNFIIFLVKELSTSHLKKWQDIISYLQQDPSTKPQEKEESKTKTLKEKLIKE